MKKYLLLLYFVLLLLIQSTLDLLSIVIIFLPVIIIYYAFFFRNVNLGILGFALFQLMVIPTIELQNFNNIQGTILVILLSIIPSIILIEIILNLEYIKIPKIEIKTAPFLTVLLLITIIIAFLFILTQISLFNIYFQAMENTTIQILLLCSLTFIICTPFLEGKKISRK
jgi:hypothetical protein